MASVMDFITKGKLMDMQDALVGCRSTCLCPFLRDSLAALAGGVDQPYKRFTSQIKRAALSNS